jgi:integration host factor subunit beta
MTKSELVDRIAEKHDLPRRTAEEVINVIFNTMRDVLVDGGRVEVRGFGSFKVKDYEGYIGRNPRTNQEIVVKPKRGLVFKVSKILRSRVNQE